MANSRAAHRRAERELVSVLLHQLAALYAGIGGNAHHFALASRCFQMLGDIPGRDAARTVSGELCVRAIGVDEADAKVEIFLARGRVNPLDAVGAHAVMAFADQSGEILDSGGSKLAIDDQEVIAAGGSLPKRDAIYFHGFLLSPEQALSRATRSPRGIDATWRLAFTNIVA